MTTVAVTVQVPGFVAVVGLVSVRTATGFVAPPPLAIVPPPLIALPLAHVAVDEAVKPTLELAGMFPAVPVTSVVVPITPCAP